MPLLSRNRESRPISSADEMPQEHRELLEKIKQRVNQEMEPLHKSYRDRWDDLNALYFNYDMLRQGYREARQVDDTAGRGYLLDQRRDWGGHLTIPYAFATVETVVPRVMSNRPNFTARALTSAAENKRGLIQDAVNQQMSDIDLELKMQPVARRAVKLGLGVQFVYWKEEKRNVLRWGRNMLGKQVPVQTEVVDRKGPWVEDVDLYDWMWDPTAKSIETCGDIMYRTWRPFSYIKEKVESGEWAKLDLDVVKGMGKSTKRHDLWQGRLQAQGLANSETQKEGHVHEVWHYFTKDRVVTILDEAFVVQDDTSPFFHRELPFQVYRPTPIEGQLPGLGVIDSIRQLIAELSTMRTQRRDAATVALNPPTFYQRGMIQRKDAKTGPGIWTPVSGDLREAIYQPPLRDLPASGYAEEDRLKADIEMTSGVSDPVAGGTGAGGTAGSETATGIQLIQAAANVRIAQMARLMLLENQKPLGRQILELNRQHQVEPEEIRVDDRDSPDGYRFEEVTPEDWNLPLELVPDEHSNEPENRPQKLDEALRFYQALQGNPDVNPREALKFFVSEWGVRDPEAFLNQQIQLDPQIAEIVGKSFYGTLLGVGMDEEQAGMIANQAMEAAAQQTGIGAGVPEQNGAAPEEAPA